MSSKKKGSPASSEKAPKKQKTEGTPKGKDKKEEKKELISADEFLKKARPLSLKIAGQEFEAKPQEFSSGSFGWGLSGKVLKVDVGGTEYNVQVTINLPIRGSKPEKEKKDKDK